MTFISQTHGYRGFTIDRDLVDVMIVCAFFTVYVSRRPLLDRLVAMLRAERKMRVEEAEQHTLAEMSCFDEALGERKTNVRRFPNVPHHVIKTPRGQ